MTRHQVTQRVAASAHWHRLRRGVFCLTEHMDGAGTPERARVLLARGTSLSAAERSGAPYALSHVSAAAVHGLPVPRAPRRHRLASP